MFLHKLRMVANFCQKQGMVREVFRSQGQPTVPMPIVSMLSRQFASRFNDDDSDDDYLPPQRKSAGGFQSNHRQGFGQRNNQNPRQFTSRFNDDEDDSDDDYSPPQRKSSGQGFFGRNNYQDNRSQFNNNNRFANNFSANRNINNNSQFGGLPTPKWDLSSLEKVEKNFYKPHEKTLSRSDEEIKKFQEEHEITLPLGAPKPILEFDELENVPKSLLDVIAKHKFEKASPIQAHAWPIALSGQNMVGIAQTGSGKTLAFILPAIVHILNQPKVDQYAGPTALVMAPTRELAQQIQTVANQFGISSGVRNACLFGGSAKMNQAADLRRGPQLVIATPGRLIDFLQTGEIQLARCTYLVLDEADRMLDMGFEPQIRQIVNQTRPDRQTLMFSATWPKEVRGLAEDFLKEYVQVNVGSLELSANHNIKQIIKICTEHSKEEELQHILQTIQRDSKPEDRKILIFTNTKRMADNVAYSLKRNGISADSIHSDRSQFQRETTLRNFRDGRVQVMVATEVAARGLDVNNIQHVINYDYPNNSSDYIHRIGRTGRSGKTGTAYTLLTDEDSNQVADLIEVMKEANQEIAPELYELAQSRRQSSGRGYKNGGRGSYNSFGSNRRY